MKLMKLARDEISISLEQVQHLDKELNLSEWQELILISYHVMARPI